MTQSAMCIPLWPARNGNTAHLVMCPFAGGSSSAFRHWQAEQLADCALSLVTGRGAIAFAIWNRSETLHNWRHCWRTSWKHPYRLTRRFYSPGTAWGRRWRLKPADFWSNGACATRTDYFRVPCPASAF